MGASEKHEAAYHGAEYTPTTERVRRAYAQNYVATVEYHENGYAEFDRRLAAHDAEVAAKVEFDMRAEFVATADVLYFNGGYSCIRRSMVERVARESSVTGGTS